MGYYGIFLGLQYQNDVEMLKTLNSGGYDASQTVSIKIPIALPYMYDQPAFERVDGIFEHQGEFYRMVSQNYTKDTLTIICVRDSENKRIHQALSSYVKTFADKPYDQHHHSTLTFSFIKDYISHSFSIITISGGWQSDVIQNNSCEKLESSFMNSIFHPPWRG